ATRLVQSRLLVFRMHPKLKSPQARLLALSTEQRCPPDFPANISAFFSWVADAFITQKGQCTRRTHHTIGVCLSVRMHHSAAQQPATISQVKCVAG
ncbi:hypothetical protein H4R99_007791, partial [Coemansia sp. RSA 1722]